MLDVPGRGLDALVLLELVERGQGGSEVGLKGNEPEDGGRRIRVAFLPNGLKSLMPPLCSI
jgi:hypothetical protein